MLEVIETSLICIVEVLTLLRRNLSVYQTLIIRSADLLLRREFQRTYHRITAIGIRLEDVNRLSHGRRSYGGLGALRSLDLLTLMNGD